MNKFHLLLTSVALLSLSGCASLSEEECQLGEWYQIGLADGQEGKKNQSATYSKDCVEYGVAVDVQRYNNGRSDGLKSYCSYNNGILVGQANKEYENVCPAELANEFLAGYTPYYNLAKASAYLRSIEDNVSYYKSKLDDESTPADERQTFTTGLKSAKAELKRVKSDVSRYELELELHKVVREIAGINEELAVDSISASHRLQLNNRLATLRDKQNYYETLVQTDNTIQNIKHIADLF
ncbi:DUF2799 domain-containing protein [Photobacterium sp. GSS17]|uniref:DUF2799 domain-containing protein n=1 Tax=Photobacterium sp. GSS17 TaxID=3020715 RepID=UPI0023611370|nr:DUF2799 domain-containing protein [Photobacterium sp. GSS17]